MRHGIFGRNLSRTIDEKNQLFSNLALAMVTVGSVKTTLAKAKAVQPIIEKLSALAKKGDKNSLGKILRTIHNRTVVKNFIEGASARFSSRSSGFTRILRLGVRLGDATEVALLTFVDPPIVKIEPIVVEKTVTKGKPKKKMSVKKQE